MTAAGSSSRASKKRRKLTAFILTIAAAPGCASEPPRGNPPPLDVVEPPTLTRNPPQPEPEPKPTAAVAVDPPAEPKPVAGDAEPSLPKAPDPTRVVKHDNGACFYQEKVTCPPRPATCNPPPPRRVACPE